MFGPAGQNALQMNDSIPSRISALGWAPRPSRTEVAFRRSVLAGNVAALRWFGLSQAQAAQAISSGGGGRTTARSQVISPGPTQVIRPSAQAPQRRAAAPQAGASSSLITSTPSPAEVALATTTLLGG
jgi:hypothetical protein